MAAMTLCRKGTPAVLEAEAMAVIEGLSFSRDVGFMGVMVETDSSVVAGLLKGKSSVLSRVGHLIDDILRFEEDFRQLSFDLYPRNCNGPAHGLARFGLTHDLDHF